MSDNYLEGKNKLVVNEETLKGMVQDWLNTRLRAGDNARVYSIKQSKTDNMFTIGLSSEKEK